MLKPEILDFEDGNLSLKIGKKTYSFEYSIGENEIRFLLPNNPKQKIDIKDFPILLKGIQQYFQINHRILLNINIKKILNGTKLLNNSLSFSIEK